MFSDSATNIKWLIHYYKYSSLQLDFFTLCYMLFKIKGWYQTYYTKSFGMFWTILKMNKSFMKDYKCSKRPIQQA